LWLTSVILATQEAEIRKSWLEASSRKPVLKKPITKKGGGMAQGVGPEFKSQY
jgi:hypothetical protein